MKSGKKHLSVHEIADYCQVNRKTVGQWIKKGRIKAYQTPGRHNRVKREDFLKFLEEYKMPIPMELMGGNDKKRILIIDDEEEMVEAMKERLAVNQEYEIETAFDGFMGGKKFNGFCPDLVLLDICMPGIDGYQVCSHIREDINNQQVKILIVSGVINEKGIERVLEIGADDFLPKPFDSQELTDKVKRLLESRQSRFS